MSSTQTRRGGSGRSVPRRAPPGSPKTSARPAPASPTTGSRRWPPRAPPATSRRGSSSASSSCCRRSRCSSGSWTAASRFGLGVVASPRHADVLLVTGPVTTLMREPLLAAYAAMPEPRRVAALGDCALGCHLLGAAEETLGGVEALLPVDPCIAGCPPAPEAIAAALLRLLDAR